MFVIFVTCKLVHMIMFDIEHFTSVHLHTKK